MRFCTFLGTKFPGSCHFQFPVPVLNLEPGFPVPIPVLDALVAIDNCLEIQTLTAILYNLSILSGPLVACVFGSFICLLPIHNVLKEPAYWYEEVLCRMLSSGFLVACQTTVEAEF